MSDTSISASRTIDASAKDVFHVLTDPHRHVELDGSGFVQGLDRGDRIEKSGQQFRMNMSGDHMGGDYQVDNHVTGYDENHLLAWRTAPAGQEPPGWEWVWELKSTGSDSVEATVTYDWSAVTDKELLKKLSFPLVPQEALETSLGNLAAAVRQS
ncbi:SRPBCC family protein [Nocardioides sp. AX2bis]|uniref:SRPBCC family protein n=1 Tax=Nocardioides sp. AX2bis TaxID=2653157 RepID=UPI0012F09A3C|nr:SRPBCC family protein [Nocardioides sp. AX2bis]VXB04794.1 Polyketide cyclase [Nocardioides sp. AX2bis]